MSSVQEEREIQLDVSESRVVSCMSSMPLGKTPKGRCHFMSHESLAGVPIVS